MGRDKGTKLERTPSDESTLQYYRVSKVVGEYDAVRFSDKGGRVLGELQERALLKALPETLGPASRVLDAGCGTGRFLGTLAGTGAQLVGLDSSSLMLAAARTRIPTANYVNANILDLPFSDNTFDLTISVWVINHLTLWEEALAEICRVSRHVVIAVPNRRSLHQFSGAFKKLVHAGVVKKSTSLGMIEETLPPFSKDFTATELALALGSQGFRVLRLQREILLPRIPGFLAPWYRDIEDLLSPLSTVVGSFMIITGRKLA